MTWDMISAVAAGVALGAPLVALVTARLGLGGRIRTMTYHEKRLTLATTILSAHAKLLSESRITGLQAEIDAIARDLITSAPEAEGKGVLNWRKKTLWRRVITVPRPLSLWGWVTSALFYFYALMGVGYLASASFIAVFRPVGFVGVEQAGIVFGMSVVAFMLAAGMKRLSLATARKRALSEEVGAKSEGREAD